MVAFAGRSQEQAWHWALWPLLLAPVAILLHELGHVGAALLLGASDVTLHHASVGYARPLHPRWHEGVVALAGPAVSALLTAGGAAWTARCGPHPVAVALMVVAPVRFLVGAAWLAVTTAAAVRGAAPTGAPRFDEYGAAVAFGLPAQPFVLATTALMLAAWGYAAARVPRGRRRAALPLLAAGTAVGLAGWLGWLGPALLP